MKQKVFSKIQEFKNGIKLKNLDPDKKFVKLVCKIIYFFGLGDCWYESDDAISIAYFIWCVIVNTFLLTVIVSQIIGIFGIGLTTKERSDGIQYTFAHVTVYGKFINLFVKRQKIKGFFKLLLEETKLPNMTAIELKSIRKSNFFIGILLFTMFFTLGFATVDSIQYHFSTGIPIRTLVTIWPGPRTEGTVPIKIIRFLVQIQWWALLTIMVAVDSISMSGLIILAFRFRALQKYFRDLKKIFVKNAGVKSLDELEIELRNNLMSGVKMHGKMMSCAKSLQDALGVVYSIQVVQSIVLIATSMIKLVILERSITTLIATLCFMIACMSLTGTYMMAGGSVTHQAALVSTSIYDCGWEFTTAKANIRTLLVVAIQNAEKPVLMTAFGVYDLSYKNFITVLMTSYKFFAVMY